MSNSALRELPGGDRIVLELDLPVSPAEAYRYWTDAALVARWWAPSTTYGSGPEATYRYSWPRQDWRLSGRVLEAEPGRRLRLTWRWEHEPDRPERDLDVRFAAHDGGTRLTVTHGPYGEAPDEAAERDEHLAGWRHFLPRLAEAARD